MSKQKLTKKLSVKSVVGNIKLMVRDGAIKDGDQIMRVYGTASALATGTSDFGDWVGFKGNFKAINLITSEAFASGKLFLPDVAGDLLEGAVSGSDGAVEFGFDIAIEYDDQSATGYIYTATPILEPAEDEALSRIEAAFKRLSPPEPESKTPAMDKAKAKAKAKAETESKEVPA